MLSFSYWKVFTCLVSACVMIACSATEGPTVDPAAPPLVAFEFTPVPTSTNDVGSMEKESADLDIDQFSIKIENVEIEIEVGVDETATSADIVPTAEPVANASGHSTSPQTEGKRVSLIDRATLESSITRSRNAISNLTYTINVADGIGTLSCMETMRYYNDVAAFEHFNTFPELQMANENYGRALNVTIVGVKPLYDFCANHLAATPNGDMVQVVAIQPATIWETAVTQSNVSIRSAEDALGWLEGRAHLLSTLYDQIDIHLAQFVNLLTIATRDSCGDIRIAYDQIVTNAILLDMGEDARNYSSYNQYNQAIQMVGRTALGLYEACHGDQVADGNNLLPGDLVESALAGIQEAQAMIEMAYYYITPPTPQAGATNSGGGAQSSSQQTDAVHRLNIFVVTVVQSSQPHLWELVLGFEAIDGIGPYALLTAGVLNGDDTILIVHTCDHNFLDNVALRDANGRLYQSDKIEVPRTGVCV